MRYDSSTHTDLTDEELIQLIRTGDEEAFAQLAARHSFQIWQLVVLNSRQTRDAEEIFQDIWISVWENIGSLRKVSSFRAWLRKIAYTACRRYYAANSHTAGEILQASVFENQIHFTDGNATLTTRLVDREYPNYQKIIPKESQGKTVVSRDQILSVTRRMAQLSNPKNYAICLEINAERIRVSTKTPELAEAHETVPVESGTGNVRIGFDARLLIESLSHINAESVSIEFSRELDPVLVKPIGDDGYISLIMPLLLELY